MPRIASLASLASLLLSFSVNSSLHAQLAFNAIVGRESVIDDSFTERWSFEPSQPLFEYEALRDNESVDAISMGPDGYLYAAGNNVGQISVFRFKTLSGKPVDLYSPTYPYPKAFATFLGGPVYDMKHGPDGNLYVAATDFGFTGPSGSAAILRRIDGASGDVTGEINLGENRFIQGVDFSPDGQFMHVLHGPLSYLAGQGARRLSTFPLPTVFAPPGFPPQPLEGYLHRESFGFTLGDRAEDVTLGPDGLLYISDSTAEAVLRYATNGQFVDEFVHEFVHDLHFIDDRLLGLLRQNWPQSNRLLEIDPGTGNVTTLIDGALDPQPGYLIFGEIAPFIVPEPGPAALLGVLAAIAPFCRSWRRSVEHFSMLGC
jgi:hypothetical protein